jgi:hypothetical protein
VPDAQKCPACGMLRINPIGKNESATETACQNSECRIVLNKENQITGRWTEGYAQFIREAPHGE